MPTKTTIVLCEDETQWLFVYRWLLARGSTAGELRVVAVPAGKRAGAQHVLESYASEVVEYRKKAKQLASRRLIVVIDADTFMVAQRLADLEAKLVAAGIDRREAIERICVLVPRRNVETWLHHFHEHPVDETTDYKSFYDGDAKGPACRRAGEAFELWLTTVPAPQATPSLEASRAEVARL